MKRFALIAALCLLVPVAQGAEEERRLLKTVLEARSCTVNSYDSRSCRFRIGEDLDFEITGIGEPDVSVTIFKAKEFDNTDFYMKFGGVTWSTYLIQPS